MTTVPWPPRVAPPPPTPVDRYAAPPDLHVIAEGLRFPEGPIACDDGSVLFVEVRGATLSRAHPSGEVEVIADLDGGPNGAAIGPDGAVYICNNGGLPWTQLPDGSWYPLDARTGSMTPAGYAGGWIERVDLLTGVVLRLYDSSDGRSLSAPNDIVFDANGEMWITDTGKTGTDETAFGAVYRARPDGSAIVTVAYGLAGPNGIGLSPDGQHLYVADTPTGRIWCWNVDELGSGRSPRDHGGTVIARLPGSIALDSLAVDLEGRIVVALPGAGALATISPDGAMWLVEMPDQMPTNVCFGGPEGRIAYVTLAATGRLVSFEWPVDLPAVIGPTTRGEASDVD